MKKAKALEVIEELAATVGCARSMSGTVKDKPFKVGEDELFGLSIGLTMAAVLLKSDKDWTADRMLNSYAEFKADGIYELLRKGVCGECEKCEGSDAE